MAVNDAHLSRLYYSQAARRQRFRSFIKRLRGIIGEINSWQDNGNFIFTAELKPINQAGSPQPNCCHWLLKISMYTLFLGFFFSFQQVAEAPFRSVRVKRKMMKNNNNNKPWMILSESLRILNHPSISDV